MRQGTPPATIIAADIEGRPRKPYKHRERGLVVDLGGAQAVARPLGISLSGRPATFVTRGSHLVARHTLGRRARTALDWLLVGRALDDVSVRLPDVTAVLAEDEHRTAPATGQAC